MQTYTCKPQDLPAGFFWFREADYDPVVVEKRAAEVFVRFTNGRQARSVREGDTFIGPLVVPA